MKQKEWNISGSDGARDEKWLEEAVEYFVDHSYYNSSRGGFRLAKGNFHPSEQEEQGRKFRNIFREVGPGIHSLVRFIYFFRRNKERKHRIENE